MSTASPLERLRAQTESYHKDPAFLARYSGLSVDDVYLRAAQQRAFKHGRRMVMRALPLAEPEQRMLEQGEQRHGLKPAERDFRRESGEQAGMGIGEHVTARVINLHAPAVERG